MVMAEMNVQPNFVAYQVDGFTHTFFSSSYLFTTDARGPLGMLLPPPELCLVDSVVRCPLSDSSSTCSGASCCSGVEGLVDQRAFVCPSAPAMFSGCDHPTKVVDCLESPPPLVSWLKHFPVGPCGRVDSECVGDLVLEPQATAGWTYCAAALAGKVFSRGGELC